MSLDNLLSRPWVAASFGRFSLLAGDQYLYSDGVMDHKLPNAERHVLALLMQANGDTVESVTLQKMLWGDTTHRTYRCLVKVVSDLRSRLAGRINVQRVRGIGYRLLLVGASE